MNHRQALRAILDDPVKGAVLEKVAPEVFQLLRGMFEFERLQQQMEAQKQRFERDRLITQLNAYRSQIEVVEQEQAETARRWYLEQQAKGNV